MNGYIIRMCQFPAAAMMDCNKTWSWSPGVQCFKSPAENSLSAWWREPQAEQGMQGDNKLFPMSEHHLQRMWDAEKTITCCTLTQWIMVWSVREYFSSVQFLHTCSTYIVYNGIRTVENFWLTGHDLSRMNWLACWGLGVLGYRLSKGRFRFTNFLKSLKTLWLPPHPPIVNHLGTRIPCDYSYLHQNVFILLYHHGYPICKVGSITGKE